MLKIQKIVGARFVFSMLRPIRVSVSGYCNHFNHISLGIDHCVKDNRAADLALSGQDRIDRVGRRDESRCLQFSTDTNWTLRRRTDWSRRPKGSSGKDPADHATRLSSRNPPRDSGAWDHSSR
jgi:hypothetical protein